MDPKPCVTKKEKHENLDDAIANIDTALHRAERLYDRIMETTPDDGSGEERKNQSLNDVLEGGAGRIHCVTENINVMLRKIEEALF